MSKIVNPFREITCPYCRRYFYPGECAIEATINYMDIKAGDTLRAARKGLLARSFVVHLSDPSYVRAGAVRKCPNCNHELLYDTITPSYTIAIVGDSFSGKSHYLASCINQFRQSEALQVIGCSQIIGQGNTDQIFFLNYYEPCFKNKETLSPNSRSKLLDPLIYELVFPNKRVNLLFYDASGEDITNPNQLLQFSHYILNASAIIFLADPMSMPGVVEALPTDLQPLPSRAFTSSQVLSQVIQTYRQIRGNHSGEGLKIPIAITVSKSDLLEFVNRSIPAPLYLRDNVLSGQVDVAQFEIISRQVQNLLTRHGDKVLPPASRMFETASFFAVSATGWPEASTGGFPSIEPRRCLDPLLWILWKLGVIASE